MYDIVLYMYDTRICVAGEFEKVISTWALLCSKQLAMTWNVECRMWDDV